MGVKAKVISKNPNGFKKVAKSYEKQILNLLGTSGNMVRNTAVQSILSGGGGGRTYEKYNPRRTHTASAEGQPPSSDTGFLASTSGPTCITRSAETTGCVVVLS